MSRRYHFKAPFSILWILDSFLLLLHDAPWTLDGVMEMFHLGLSTHSHSFSALCQAPSFCINHCRLKTEGFSDQSWAALNYVYKHKYIEGSEIPCLLNTAQVLCSSLGPVIFPSHGLDSTRQEFLLWSVDLNFSQKLRGYSHDSYVAIAPVGTSCLPDW